MRKKILHSKMLCDALRGIKSKAGERLNYISFNILRTKIKLERIYPEAKGMNCLTIFTLVNDCVVFSKIRSIFLYEETNLLLSNDVNERKLKETSF